MIFFLKKKKKKKRKKTSELAGATFAINSSIKMSNITLYHQKWSKYGEDSKICLFVCCLFLFTFLADATDESQVHYSVTPHSLGEDNHGAHEDVIGELKGFL
jgi:hypothetical protein